MVKESGVPLLVCEHSGVDSNTPTGKWFLGHLALNAELEGELASTRTKAALAECKARGKKLGTANPKVAKRSAMAQKKRAQDKAQRLSSTIKGMVKNGMGAPSILEKLNDMPKAIAINGRLFTLSTVSRLLKRM